MELALYGRSIGRSGKQLPRWITLSIFAHAVLLASGIASVPLPAPARLPSLTVDIRHLAPESESPQIYTSAAQQEVQTVRRAPESPRAGRATEDTRGQSVSAATESQFPFAAYFNINEVDVRAEPVNDPPLRYPWVEYQQRLAGVVRFTLFINAQGGLDKVHLIDGTPPGYFEEAALEAVTQLRFRPAMKNGRPVASQKTIDVVFDPNESVDKTATAS